MYIEILFKQIPEGLIVVKSALAGLMAWCYKTSC